MTAVTALTGNLRQIAPMRRLRFSFTALVIAVLAFTLALLPLVLPQDGETELLRRTTEIALLLGAVALLMATIGASRHEDKRLYLAAVGFAVVTILIPFIFSILSLFGGALILVAVVGAVVSCAF